MGFTDIVRSKLTLHRAASSTPTSPAKSLIGLSMAETPLNKFLRERKTGFLQAIKDGAHNKWVLVMGNEAGDLDSIASAIAYAYLSPRDTNIVPLIQIGHDSLHLRPENLLAFEHASLDKSSLLTVSDLPASSDKKLADTKYVLVDHNKLLPSFSGDVISILDHHDDSGEHTAADPRVIKPVGSCSSLVTLHFKETLCSYTGDDVKDVANLLLSAILIDTGSLRDKKALSEDKEAAQILLPKVTKLGGETGSDFSSESMDRHFGQLSKAKNDVQSLSTWDLLRRDYKEYHYTNGIRCGLATVPMKLKSWKKREKAANRSFWKGPEEWMDHRKLQVLGILTTYKGKSGKGKRQIAMIVKGKGKEYDQLMQRLVSGFEGEPALSLKAKPLKRAPETLKVVVWKQGNTRATRKQIAPLTERCILNQKRTAPLLVAMSSSNNTPRAPSPIPVVQVTPAKD